MKNPYKQKRPEYVKRPDSVGELPSVMVPLQQEWAIAPHALQRAEKRLGIENLEDFLWMLPQAKMQVISKGIKEKGGRVKNWVLVRPRDGREAFVAVLEMTDRIPVVTTIMTLDMVAGNLQHFGCEEFADFDELFPGAD